MQPSSLSHSATYLSFCVVLCCGQVDWPHFTLWAKYRITRSSPIWSILVQVSLRNSLVTARSKSPAGLFKYWAVSQRHTHGLFSDLLLHVSHMLGSLFFDFANPDLIANGTSERKGFLNQSTWKQSLLLYLESNGLLPGAVLRKKVTLDLP